VKKILTAETAESAENYAKDLSELRVLRGKTLFHRTMWGFAAYE